MSEEIIQKAEEYALSEIEKHGMPPKFLFDFANKKGEELAERFNADSKVVQVAMRLMDIKLGEAVSQGKLKDHVEMSVEATRKFLDNFDVSQEKKDKILKCVSGHHDTSWDLKEAEICANADCYKFLDFKKWLKFLYILNKRDKSLDEALTYAEKKADEKWRVLSMESCKKELEQDYKLIKEIIDKAKP